jgi:phosphate transport system substrate-binding protein
MYCVSHLRFSTFLLLALFTLAATDGARSQEIELQQKGGDLTIRGELIRADEENYVVEAVTLGRITVSRNNFTCIGDACPEAGPASTGSLAGPARTVRVHGTIGALLFPQLIRDFSGSIGASLKQTAATGGAVNFSLGEAGAEPVSFDVSTESSGSVISALSQGKADIALTSRQITDGEIGTLRRSGFIPVGQSHNQFPIGFDGISVIVSPENPVTALSVEDISRIFAGEVTDWSEFGAPAGRITLYSPPSGDDRNQAFADLVLKPYRRALRGQPTVLEQEPELAKAVSADKFGVGFVGIRNSAPAKALGIKDTCGLIHTPSFFTVLSSEYPLSRMIYLHIGQMSDDMRSKIARFAISPAGDDAVERAGFVSRSVRTLPFDFFRAGIVSSVSSEPDALDMALLKQLLIDLDTGYRLSTTLRFEAASIQLEKESEDALARVVAFLKEQDLTKRKILVAGYSDTSGNPGRNKVLSSQRAEAARQALLTAGTGVLKVTQISAAGYGQMFPISCNDTEDGRNRNRRVEIWLVPAKSSGPSLLTKPL